MEKKDRPVRISEEALKWVRIASGYTGESMAEYVSRIVMERGKADADELHARASSDAGPSRSRGKGGRP